MTDLTILFAQLNLKPIAYNSIYTKITGSLTAGVLLSQLIYWSATRKEDEKEFWKTDADLMQETGMTIKELAGAKFRVAKFVQILRKGVPAKTHYLVNELTIINEIISYAKTAQLDMPKGDNLLPQNSTTSYAKTAQHIYAENTTENTTENIKKENPKPQKFDAEKHLESLELDSEIKQNLKSWLEVRKTKKTATTQNAVELQIKFLSKFSKPDQIQMIQNSVMGGWTGIFELKPNYQKPNFNQNNTQFRQKLGNLTDEQAKEKYANFYTEAKESVLLPSDPIEMYQRNYEHQFSD